MVRYPDPWCHSYVFMRGGNVAVSATSGPTHSNCSPKDYDVRYTVSCGISQSLVLINVGHARQKACSSRHARSASRMYVPETIPNERQSAIQYQKFSHVPSLGGSDPIREGRQSPPIYTSRNGRARSALWSIAHGRSRRRLSLFIDAAGRNQLTNDIGE